MKIGQKIKNRRLELKMSQAQLARKLNYRSRSSINKIELGYNDITQSKVAEFAEALRTTPAYLMDWQETDEYSATPSLIAISPLTLAETAYSVNENAPNIILPEQFFDSKRNYFYHYMADESLADEAIHTGDLVIFEETNKLKNGQIGYIQTTDQAKFCRKYFIDKESMSVTLLSGNNHYPPLNYQNSQIKIRGRLIYTLAKK
ncbi:MAG: S24 family peptidase [Erysipelotrichaceae bacterium]|nr:S24 family peptidase [Erysipelotrichaceae bacterium]